MPCIMRDAATRMHAADSQQRGQLHSEVDWHHACCQCRHCAAARTLQVITGFDKAVTGLAVGESRKVLHIPNPTAAAAAGAARSNCSSTNKAVVAAAAAAACQQQRVSGGGVPTNVPLLAADAPCAGAAGA